VAKLADAHAEIKRLRGEVGAVTKQKQESDSKGRTLEEQFEDLRGKFEAAEAERTREREARERLERKSLAAERIDEAIASLPEAHRKHAKNALKVYQAEGKFDFAAKDPPTPKALERLQKDYPEYFNAPAKDPKDDVTIPRHPMISNGQQPRESGRKGIENADGERIF
jgi:hypothetical protein